MFDMFVWCLHLHACANLLCSAVTWLFAHAHCIAMRKCAGSFERCLLWQRSSYHLGASAASNRLHEPDYTGVSVMHAVPTEVCLPSLATGYGGEHRSCGMKKGAR
jgi:hypothetical protein